MLLVDSAITFAAAFGLEVLLFSNESWVRIPICAVLLIVTLLILWCVGTMFETELDFSGLGKPRAFKDLFVKFTGSLRGKTEESGVCERGAGDDGGQGTNGILERTGSMRSALGRRWRGRQRGLTNATLVNPPESNCGYGPPDGAGVYTDERNKEAVTSEV